MTAANMLKIAMIKEAIPAWQRKLLQGSLSEPSLGNIAAGAGLTKKFFQKTMKDWKPSGTYDLAGMQLPDSPMRSVLNNFRWALRERPFKQGDRLNFSESARAQLKRQGLK